VRKNKLNLVIDVLAYLAMAGLASTGLIMLYHLPPGTGGRHSGEPARTLLGLGRHDWGDIHFGIAATFIALMLLHIILHWKWITNTFGSLVRSREARKPGAGRGGAVLLILLGLAAAGVISAPWLIGVDKRERGGRGYRGGRRTQLTCDECDAAGPSAGKPAATPGSADERGRGKVRGETRRETQAPPARPEGHERHAEHDHSIRGKTTLGEAAKSAGVPVERLIAELKLPANTPRDEHFGRLRRQYGFSMEDVRAVVARLRKAAKTE